MTLSTRPKISSQASVISFFTFTTSGRRGGLRGRH
jgi:hypothetical protein